MALNSYGIKADCVNYSKNNNFFYFDIKLKSYAKIKDLVKYANEIACYIKADAKPTIKTLHSKGVVRLEFIDKNSEKLSLFDYFSNQDIPDYKIPVLLGQAVDGSKIWLDLHENPHLLISGCTGSGKSVLLHNIIANLFNYSDVDLYLVDSKLIEFSNYKKIVKNVVSSYVGAVELLSQLDELMEYRYTLMQSKEVFLLKPIFLIIDEFADLIAQDNTGECYDLLSKLAQKSRAANIHLILATQRPTTNIVNGNIKANISTRIACKASSHIDSKVILDSVGAEDLIGKGDALLKDNFRNLERFQVAFTTSEEVVKFFS